MALAISPSLGGDVAQICLVFYNAQFGIRLTLSTNNALMSITETVQSELDQKKFCSGVFVDLKKAFYTVDHEILLKKTIPLWNYRNRK